MRFLIPLKKKQQFQRVLLRWYKQHGRDLPWRRTHDPYAILVSEMMLQQTQVDRVLEKYTQWMVQFPTVHVLVRASKAEVIAAWQGLGYNRRALYLHRIAETVVKEHSGVFPANREELLALPGIGPYTAGAIMSFAFHKEEPIVDTNVRRVIGRIFVGYKRLARMNDDAIWNLAAGVLPRNMLPRRGQQDKQQRGQVYAYNQALMDVGATICINRKPQCGVCPFQKICRSYPVIQSVDAKELKLKKSKERLYYGQPRRIWRGKILRFLHSYPSGSAAYIPIGKAIQKDFSANRINWLRAVVQSLEKDGFVKSTGKKVSLLKN